MKLLQICIHVQLVTMKSRSVLDLYQPSKTSTPHRSTVYLLPSLPPYTSSSRSVKAAKSKKVVMYTVTYDSSSHMKVIFQRLGSVWPKVFPYCIFNVALMAAIQLLHNIEGINLAISNTGHTFMSLILAFLIVTRVNISVGRYSEARNNLEIMYRESRELVQNCCVFSDHISDVKGKEWRSDVAYRCMLLLRTAMAVVDYPTTKCPAWDVPELSNEEKEQLTSHLFCEISDRPRNALRWAHHIRTEEEENMRVPGKMAYKLRSVIHSQSALFGSKKIETNPELKLLGSVDSFMGGYYGYVRRWKNALISLYRYLNCGTNIIYLDNLCFSTTASANL